MFVMGITTISSLMGNVQTSPIDTNLVSYQDATPPTPVEQVPSAAQATQESISDKPIVDTPVPAGDSVLQGPVEVQQGEMPADVYFAPTSCGTCCCQPCCCRPCPVSTTFVIVDPCTCCSYEICVNVPPCCVGNAPAVDWRGGIFGRRVARLCWNCCDKQVKVVVTRRGKVRVRG